jgi:hypothetical protein
MWDASRNEGRRLLLVGLGQEEKRKKEERTQELAITRGFLSISFNLNYSQKMPSLLILRITYNYINSIGILKLQIY